LGQASEKTREVGGGHELDRTTNMASVTKQQAISLPLVGIDHGAGGVEQAINQPG